MLNEDFFRVENHLLVLNKDYIRGISEYKTILVRDKGSDGDKDGRDKKRAWKEFFYIYIKASFFSHVNKGGYDDRSAHEFAVREAELESDFKPDIVIKAAIEKYKKIQLEAMPSLKAISTALKGLRIADTIAENLTDSMQQKLQANEDARLAPPIEGAEPVNLNIQAAAELATYKLLVEQLQEVQKISTKIPEQIELLELLYERLKKEQSATDELRGGREKGNRADPR